MKKENEDGRRQWIFDELMKNLCSPTPVDVFKAPLNDEEFLTRLSEIPDMCRESNLYLRTELHNGYIFFRLEIAEIVH